MAVKDAAELAAALQRTQERVRELDQELEEARAAVLRTLTERPEQTIDELAEQLHVDGDVLGVSRQRVDERLRAGRLIGLRDRAGRRWFPGYQFHDGRPLEDLIAAY